MFFAVVALFAFAYSVDAGCPDGTKQLVAVTCDKTKKILACPNPASQCKKPSSQELLMWCKKKYPATVKASLVVKYTGCYPKETSFWKSKGVMNFNSKNFCQVFPVVRTSFGVPKGTCMKLDTPPVVNKPVVNKPVVNKPVVNKPAVGK
jgi:hypothetical protein